MTQALFHSSGKEKHTNSLPSWTLHYNEKVSPLEEKTACIRRNTLTNAWRRNSQSTSDKDHQLYPCNLTKLGLLSCFKKGRLHTSRIIEQLANK
jgi:hypothetical protein